VDRAGVPGDDGIAYAFLLKGHEDLRQDERVMQLFGLVNSLLSLEQETARSNLAIQRYSVVPLSSESGLIGWVPNCDTLHSLVQSYRTARSIPLKVEVQLTEKMAGLCYESLPLLRKVEVFEHALNHTTGKDLAQVLWLHSGSAERWLERRTNFGRSLALMSMVGYILGLGDRHLSNLMLDKFSGEVLHIDFGDCFEVAIQREKFPETVPFRLTRMLVKAMGVSGTEGNYRCTCEATMGALRRHKGSLMAMLEAFLHDPLINWRLARPAEERASSAQTSAAVSAIPKPIADSRHAVPVRFDRSVGSVLEPPKRFESSKPAVEDSEERQLHAQAITVVRRVKSKLLGTDFGTLSCTDGPLDVPTQIELLIGEAQSHFNLCQLYVGWNPFW